LSLRGGQNNPSSEERAQPIVARIGLLYAELVDGKIAAWRDYFDMATITSAFS
jgi:limonene-1,2-epoxide hydrolase